MKKTIVISSIVLGTLVLLIIIILAWHGMFSRITFSEKEMGPYYFVYEDYTGSYSETMPVFDKVYKELKSKGINSTCGIGIYLDNPETTPTNQLRSKCGSIYPIEDSAKISNSMLKKEFISRQKFIVSDFPIKSPLSYFIGPMKYYAALEKYIQQKGYTMTQAIEIYDMHTKTTHYLIPLSK